MSKYEVTVGSKTWICDTLAEARALESREKIKLNGKIRNGSEANEGPAPTAADRVAAARQVADEAQWRNRAPIDADSEAAARTLRTMIRFNEQYRTPDTRYSVALAQAQLDEVTKLLKKPIGSRTTGAAPIALPTLTYLEKLQAMPSKKLIKAAHALLQEAADRSFAPRNISQVRTSIRNAVIRLQRGAQTPDKINDLIEATDQLHVGMENAHYSHFTPHLGQGSPLPPPNYSRSARQRKMEAYQASRAEEDEENAPEVDAPAGAPDTQRSIDARAARSEDDFSDRPVGIEEGERVENNRYWGGSFNSVKQERRDYLFTISAPKCMAPMAVYLHGEGYVLFSPDDKKLYGRGYFDSSEESENGCTRQHMSGLANKREDAGKGLGGGFYMAGPLALVHDEGTTCTFSPSQQDCGGHQYSIRSGDAAAAWQRLVDKGIADSEWQGGTESVTQRIRVTEYLPDDASDFDSDWTDITGTSPTHVIVEGEKDGNSCEVAEMYLRTVLKEAIVLHCSDDYLQKLEQARGYGQIRQKLCPSAEGLAELDFSSTPTQWVRKYLDFCAKHSVEANYKAEFAVAARGNTSAPEGFESGEQLGLPLQNPRGGKKRNPKAEKWLKRMKDPTWGDIL